MSVTNPAENKQAEAKKEVKVNQVKKPVISGVKPLKKKGYFGTSYAKNH